MGKTKHLAFLSLLVMSTLVGCAGVQSENPPAATEVQEEATQPTNSETASPSFEALTFDEIAIASCERALAEGVEEITAGETYRQVMIPKEEAVDGYSAAWEDLSSGEVGLIWEADAFLSCAPAMTIWLAEEAGEQPVWEVTESGSSFTLFQDFGEYGSQTIVFDVADGLFVGAEVVEGEKFRIEYGVNLSIARDLLLRAIKGFES